MKYTNIASFFDEKGPEDIERFIDKNLDISEQISSLLAERNWTQQDLAKALGKSNAEISKWLSGSHNLTLRSIAKMEVALKADIIITPEKAAKQYHKVKYVTLKVYAKPNQVVKNKSYTNYQTMTNTDRQDSITEMIKVA